MPDPQLGGVGRRAGAVARPRLDAPREARKVLDIDAPERGRQREELLVGRRRSPRVELRVELIAGSEELQQRPRRAGEQVRADPRRRRLEPSAHAGGGPAEILPRDSDRRRSADRPVRRIGDRERSDPPVPRACAQRPLRIDPDAVEVRDPQLASAVEPVRSRPDRLAREACGTNGRARLDAHGDLPHLNPQLAERVPHPPSLPAGAAAHVRQQHGLAARAREPQRRRLHQGALEVAQRRGGARRGMRRQCGPGGVQEQVHAHQRGPGRAFRALLAPRRHPLRKLTSRVRNTAGDHRQTTVTLLA